jgi:hypothetical protein
MDTPVETRCGRASVKKRPKRVGERQMLTIAGAVLVITAAVAGVALIVHAGVAARRRGSAAGTGSGRSAPGPGGAGPLDPNRSNLVGWRFARLLRAGCDAGLAKRLAERPDIDVHAVVSLIRRGCPAPLAARIAEPLPAGRARRRRPNRGES